jgi:hypothetical protein
MLKRMRCVCVCFDEDCICVYIATVLAHLIKKNPTVMIELKA